jgi:hypothetical protein
MFHHTGCTVPEDSSYSPKVRLKFNSESEEKGGVWDTDVDMKQTYKRYHLS